ncbi:hypothetical protein [Allorhizocola rhizosphaerae]|uniref:hypothetical protein n=1 Tax=Allorhizocola rhizosphaerae TaxID=1872709 RepID=UPI0013C2C4D2|nr:hypothetical protein [Allorhizocola rhizosphaerae]
MATTFAAVTRNVPAQSFVHPNRYPLSEPGALDPARRHALVWQRLTGLDADLPCLQEVEPEIHHAVRARFEATHHIAHRDATAPDDTWLFAGDFNAVSRRVVLPSPDEPSDHLPLRVEFRTVTA